MNVLYVRTLYIYEEKKFDYNIANRSRAGISEVWLDLVMTSKNENSLHINQIRLYIFLLKWPNVQ